MVRKLWAICAACGAEYDYEFGSRIFHRIGGDDEPGGPDMARSHDHLAREDLPRRVELTALPPTQGYSFDAAQLARRAGTP